MARAPPLMWNANHKIILGAYEPIIRKRWAKKSKAQRIEILKKAYPEIPTEHAPELAGLREGWDSKETTEKRLEDRATPYINLEDLSQGIFLCLFLNSRG